LASGQVVGQVETPIGKSFFRKVATGPTNTGQVVARRIGCVARLHTRTHPAKAKTGFLENLARK
jgi:hypothetical protein